MRRCSVFYSATRLLTRFSHLWPHAWLLYGSSSETLLFWAWCPSLLYMGVFTLVPVVSTPVLSFRTPEGHWRLGAFRALAAHYQFGEAVVNTLAITALGLLIELSLGLAEPWPWPVASAPRG